MDPRHSILFEPLQIGPKTLPNRFYQVPHCSSFGSNKPKSQAALRGIKAEGGWGAVSTEECSIHPESDQFPHVLARLWDDDDIANLSLMCEKAHEQGALAGVELWYGGNNPLNMESRAVSRGPSSVVHEVHHNAPTAEMDKSDIEEVQGFYVQAAERARRAGFDIVIIYGGHDGLLEQFMSPVSNQRDDEYGGTPENRARFFREVVAKVHDAVGEDLAISVRLTADSLRGPDGIELERDVIPFIRACDDVVDLWDVYIGGFDWGDDANPSRFFSAGRSLDWVKRVKEVSRKPVVGVGRFTDPDQMVRAINDGALDVIGAARPSIADPFLPNKIKEGRLDDIRECIGCNMCVARFEVGGPAIVCTQNATAGEEYRRGWHPEIFTRAKNAEEDVLIVGAGPAGMECARVLGERGMNNVHLVDGAGEMGGHLNWLTRLPGLSEWNRITEYRMIQLNKLKNVTYIPNTRLTTEEIINYGAGIVVLATGSRWAATGIGPVSRDGIPGADATKPDVLTPEQIMVEGKKVPGDRVVIIDHDGYHVAASLADKLSAEGKDVTILTHLAQVAPLTDLTLESTFLRKKLHAQGVRHVTSVVPTRYEGGGVWAHYAYASAEEAVLYEADACVLVTQRLPNDSLYRSIQSEYGESGLAEEDIHGLYRIGDALAPRVIAEAVFDGHRLAREIDSENPAIALPYKRERALLSIRDLRNGVLTP